MLASFLLSLREGIEAALLIGIVLGALHKLNRSEMAPAVWYGTLSAVGVSIITGCTSSEHLGQIEQLAKVWFSG